MRVAIPENRTMSIILLRHGETALNAARVLQPADTPLSDRGIAQARAAARRLAELGVAGIVSSDLPRARMTAEPLEAATGLLASTTELLQERNFGELRGRGYDELGFDPMATEYAPPGGEDWDTFRERVARAFAHVVGLRALLSGNLAVVTHGLVIRAMLAEHARLSDASALPQRLGNTSITVLAPAAPHLVSLLNCVRHLDEPIADDRRALSGF
jgi:probable phosphoglycerate mutase